MYYDFIHKQFDQLKESPPMKYLLLLSLAVLFFSFSALPQKKYYFRYTHKNLDEGNGSKEYPFLSLGAVSKLKLKPGDTIFFWGGNVFSGTIHLSDIHGDVHKPIVFTSFGKERAEIHSGDKEAFVITRSSNFLISDLI